MNQATAFALGLLLAVNLPGQQITYELQTNGILGVVAGRVSQSSQPNQRIPVRLELKSEDRQSPPNLATAQSVAEVGLGGVRVIQKMAALRFTRPMTAASTVGATSTPGNQRYRGTIRTATRVPGRIVVTYRARQSVANTRVSGSISTPSGRTPFVVDDRWHTVRIPATADARGLPYDLECGQRADDEGAFDWEIQVLFVPDTRCTIRTDRASCSIAGTFDGTVGPLGNGRGVLSLELRGSFPSSPTLLVLSTSGQTLPWNAGCILLTQPTALELAATTANGTLRRQFTIPAGARGTAYFQAIVQLPIFNRLVASNTLRLDCR